MNRQTSIEAWQRAKDAGILQRNQLIALQWIAEELTPLTSGEILTSRGIRNVNGWRARITELAAIGAIREVGRRRCRVSGRLGIVWEVAPWPWRAPTPRATTRDLLQRALTALEAIPDLTARAEAAAIREELAR